MQKQIFQNLLQIVQRDINKRGIHKLIPKNNVENFISGLDHLHNKSKNIAILTGFQCNRNLDFKAENDGIAGALIIARQLLRLNKKVKILIDYQYEKEFQNLSEKYLQNIVNIEQNYSIQAFQPKIDNKEVLQSIYQEYDTFLSIERPSITKSNQYLTMNAYDITEYTANIDPYLYPTINQNQLFLGNKNKDQKYRISIGDGGNEVGMGNVIEQVIQNVKFGDQICGLATCDSLVVCDVSNWGAFAYTEGLNIYQFLQQKNLNQENLLQEYQKHCNQYGITINEEKQLYLDVAEQGFRDGIVQLLDGTVDGQPLDVTLNIIQEIKQQFIDFLNKDSQQQQQQ